MAGTPSTDQRGAHAPSNTRPRAVARQPAVTDLAVPVAPCATRHVCLNSGMTQESLPNLPPDVNAHRTAPDRVRVFVNERGVGVPSGATALDAVRALDPLLGDALAAGRQRLTDSRGLPIEPTARVHGGAIFRVLPVRASADELLAAESTAGTEGLA